MKALTESFSKLPMESFMYDHYTVRLFTNVVGLPGSYPIRNYNGYQLSIVRFRNIYNFLGET